METRRVLIKWPRVRHFSFIVGSALAICVLFATWVSCLRLPFIDQNFSYNADLQITISPYSTVNNRYEGQRYGFASYSIRPIQTTASTARLQNTNRITMLDDNTTRVTTNQYNVNSRNGTLVDAAKDSTYLFAPRKSAKGKSFNYWYAPYKRAVTMRFCGAETIFGLSAYCYSAEFKQDAQATSAIRIWTEPTTGWLLKRQVTTTRYQDGHIARTTTSNFTEASIRQHVAYARQLKTRLDFGQEVAPGILLLGIATVLLAIAVRAGRIRVLAVKLPVIAVLAVGVANICGWIWNIRPLLAFAPSDAALNPLASVCFIALATSLLLIYRRRRLRLAGALGLAVAVIACTAALGTAKLLPFRLDELLFHADVLALDATTPAHTSLFGSLVLITLGAGVARAATGSRGLLIARYASTTAITLGVVGLVAKLILLDRLFVGPTIATLSLSGSILCILCGVSLLRVSFREHSPQAPIIMFAKSALLTIPLIAIGIHAQLQQNLVTQKLRSNFDKQVTSMQGNIRKNVEVYTNALVGTKALFAASQSVERDEWHQYVQALDITRFYPGMQIVGFAAIVPTNQIDAATGKTQLGSYPLTIFPLEKRDVHVPVLYTEPPNKNTQRLLGYDLATDSNRSSAMRQAAYSGSAVISGKTSLLQETNSMGQNGFLIFLPVYSNSVHPVLKGYVYATIDARAFFVNALKDYDPDIHVAVNDGFTTDSSSRLYSTALATEPSWLSKSNTVYMDGHPWTITYTATKAFRLGGTDEQVPGFVLMGGGLLYLAGLYVYLQLTAGRRRTAAPTSTKTPARPQTDERP